MNRPNAIKVYRKGNHGNHFYISRDAAARIIRHNRRNAKLVSEGAWSVRIPALVSDLMLVAWYA